MATLIEQLQQEALDPATSISDLLRKAKVVASKLDLVDAAKWIDAEMNGYFGDAEPPAYRTVAGEALYRNPFHGWSQIILGNAELDEMVRVQRLRMPASELEALSKGAPDDMIRMPWPPSFLQSFSEATRREAPHACTAFPVSAVVRVLDSIRSRILDWAVELEKAGVRGEGTLSFSKKDREAASHVTNTFNITGPVTGTLGQVGGVSNVHISSVPPDAIATLREFAVQLAAGVGGMGLGAEKQAQLEATVENLRAELARPAPAPSKIGSALASIKTIAEGTASSLLASGVLQFLATNPIAQALIAKASGG